MSTPHDAVVVLSRALDQAGDALADVHADDLDKPTPCEDWTVRELAANLAASPTNFLAMGRGEEVDWSATPDLGGRSYAETFRNAADDLIHQWHQSSDDEAPLADWQTAELAVHTWDLVTATGHRRDLDAEVAERALAVMQEGLTPDNRGSVFRPAVPVAGDASAYDRLVAWAGRDPSA